MSNDDIYPYVGLRPYKSTESIKFFGRNEQINELLHRLKEYRFLAIVGSSGCGKSSLLLAGLIPALEGGYLLQDSNKWMIAIMKPGQSPMYNLAEAILNGLGKKAESEQVNKLVQKIKKKGVNAIISLIAPFKIEEKFNFFLLVDQFEELFRFTTEQPAVSSQNEAIAFVNIMLEIAKQSLIPFHVVLTMRSDFIGDCAQFYDLPEAMNKSQYLVPRLNRQQLKMVIEGPAKLYGGKFNSILTSKLLNSLGQVQDELPVLQHALMRMWDYEKNVDQSGELDLVDFKNIGGFEKALSKDANKALNELEAEDKPIAEQLFKALTTIDENGRKIRRRLKLSDLIALTGVEEYRLMCIIDYFVKDRRSFLYVREVADSGDILIDISHESLIRQWNKLDEWVDEESETAKFYKRLAEASRQYNLPVKEKDLLTGSELDLALEWRNKYEPTAVWANRYKEGFDASMTYLNESEVERKRLQDIDAKRIRKQKTTSRGVMGLLMLIIFSGIIITAVTNHNTKTRNLHNEARALEIKDPTKALLNAAEALQRSDNFFYKTSEQDNFRNTAEKIYQEHSLYTIISSPRDTLIKKILSDGKEIFIKTGDPLIKAISSDGTKILIKGDSLVNNFNYLLVNEKGELQKEFDLDAPFRYASYSKDGSQLLICCDKEPNSLLWYVNENKLVSFPAQETSDDRNVIIFPKKDRIIMNVARKGPVLMYSMDKELIKTIFPKIDAVTFMILDSQEGKLFVSGSEGHELFDSQGEPLLNSNIHPNVFSQMGRLNTAVFSTDGVQIITASATEKKATLWDLKGNKITEFLGHRGLVNFVTFTPNNAQIITAAKDNRVILWNRQGDIIQEFVGHDKPVISVEFTNDGKSILTSSKDGTTRLWHLKNGVSGNYFPLDKPVRIVFNSSKNNMILTGFDNGDATLWGSQNQKIRDFPGYSEKFEKSSVALSPDGSHVITVGKDLKTRLWTIDKNKIIDSTIFAGAGHIKAFAFSPNGKYIVSTTRSGEVFLKNLKGEILSQIKLPNSVNAVAFSPLDNEKIVAVATKYEIVLLNMEATQAKIIKEYKGHSNYVVSVAFAPDGKKMVTGSHDRKANLWNLNDTESIPLIGLSERLNSVNFSPDGNFIITGSDDKTAIIWDLNGNKVQEIIGHTNAITSVAFFHDNSKVIVGSKDQSVMVWDVIPKLSLNDFLNGETFKLIKLDNN